MPKTLVFFATYNEAGNVSILINSILKHAPTADILVIDDSSSDGTVDVMRELGLPNLTILVRPGKLGLGGAHLLAFAYACQHGYDIIVTMDGDLSHDPSDIPALLSGVASGADICIGSRYMAGGSCDYTGYRRHVSILGNIMARTVLRIPLHEFTTSFRAFRVSALRNIDFSMLCVDGYSFFLRVVAVAHGHGLRIEETPIHFHERNYGTSKIPPLEIFRGMANLGRLALSKAIATPPIFPPAPTAPCPQCKTQYSLIHLAGAGDKCVFCGISDAAH